MIKVISVVGARPNFMKVAPISRAFKKYEDKVKHYIVHTGQHYDVNMSDAFFKDLEIPQPDYFLGIGSGSHAVQTAKIMMEFENICNELKPDLIIVVGDVNSTVACTLTAVKMGIKVAHVEGGLRSFDREMPEEINRMVTDSICDCCFTTEKSANINLKKENYPEDRIYFVGNTMIDSQYFALSSAEKSNVVKELNLNVNQYVLATLHRPSNVDNVEQLTALIEILEYLSNKEKQIVLPLHPRTKKNLEKYNLYDRVKSIKTLILTEPKGYIEFLALMKNCAFVMTDSGGIQEETTSLLKPCLTLRTTTERPSTIEEGTNILVAPDKEKIIAELDKILSGQIKSGKVPELWDGKAAERITDIIVNRIFV